MSILPGPQLYQGPTDWHRHDVVASVRRARRRRRSPFLINTRHLGERLSIQLVIAVRLAAMVIAGAALAYFTLFFARLLLLAGGHP